jgi:hypothetical protein
MFGGYAPPPLKVVAQDRATEATCPAMARMRYSLSPRPAVIPEWWGATAIVIVHPGSTGSYYQCGGPGYSRGSLRIALSRRLATHP